MRTTLAAVAVVTLSSLAACGTALTARTEGPPAAWGSRFTSPGVRLTYREISRTSLPGGGNGVSYRLTADGFPRDTTYSLWAKWLNGSTTEIAKAVRVDAAGRVMDQDGTEVDLLLASFFEGEPIQYALVAADETARAFVKIIPFPIEARTAGGCRLSLELASPRGDVFLLQGEGFEPSEHIQATGVSDGEQLSESGRVSDKGDFVSILRPAVAGRTGGVAGVTVSGRSCSASLRYNWGDAMKRG